MERVNLETKILAALYENAKGDNGFMSIRDIGIAIYKDGYIARTATIFDKMVKDRMFKVRELAEQQGRLIIPRRKATKGNREKGFKILGWKIATDEDKKFIEDEFLYKLSNGEAKKASTIKFAELAINKGMLPGEKLKELQS